MDKFFHRNIRYLRQQKGLSQDDLCNEIGCSKSALSQYERGESEPTLHVIDNIVRYFGVDFDTITHTDIQRHGMNVVSEPAAQYQTELTRLKIENQALKDALREIGKGMQNK